MVSKIATSGPADKKYNTYTYMGEEESFPPAQGFAKHPPGSKQFEEASIHIKAN